MKDPRPTASDLDLERRVVEAEMPQAFAPSAGLTTFRYGLGDIGNAHAGVPALPSITSDEVAGWITRWCTAGQAVLSLSGPPPAGLDLTLPTQAPDRPVAVPPRVRLTGPSLIACSKTGVAVSVLASTESAPWVRDALTEVLSRELRERRGLIYSVDPEVTTVSDETAQIDLVLDPVEGDTEETARQAVAALRAAPETIDQRVLSVVHGMAEVWLNEPDAWYDYLEADAHAQLRGGHEKDPDALLAAARGLTLGDLQDVVREALSTLMVAVDAEDVEDDVQLASELDLVHCTEMWGLASTAPRRGPGRRWRGRLGSGGSWIRLDGRRLYLHDGDITREVDLPDIVLAGRFAEGDLALVDDCGDDVVIEPSMFRRGEEAVAAILHQLAPEVVRDFSWYDARPERSSPPEDRVRPN